MRRLRISLYSESLGSTFSTKSIQAFWMASSSVWQVMSMYSLALASEIISESADLSEMNVLRQPAQLRVRSRKSFICGSIAGQDAPSRSSETKLMLLPHSLRVGCGPVGRGPSCRLYFCRFHLAASEWVFSRISSMDSCSGFSCSIQQAVQ